ncbi:hypothetical protein CRG98_038206 [Punica granatum]|uniref:Uncharacterized protein n=1 Tax=Punica granatum TaxID=22663 RepID=A0A2I0IC65_PUNGR|nr:hypothetical protein CRG98_038206 [Punica granatum]
MANEAIHNHPNDKEQEVEAIQAREQRIERMEQTLKRRANVNLSDTANIHPMMEEGILHNDHGPERKDERPKPIDCKEEKIEEVPKIVESPKKEKVFEAKIELTLESQELPISLEEKIIKMSSVSKSPHMEFQALANKDPSL